MLGRWSMGSREIVNCPGEVVATELKVEVVVLVSTMASSRDGPKVMVAMKAPAPNVFAAAFM